MPIILWWVWIWRGPSYTTKKSRPTKPVPAILVSPNPLELRYPKDQIECNKRQSPYRGPPQAFIVSQHDNQGSSRLELQHQLAFLDPLVEKWQWPKLLNLVQQQQYHGWVKTSDPLEQPNCSKQIKNKKAEHGHLDPEPKYWDNQQAYDESVQLQHGHPPSWLLEWDWDRPKLVWVEATEDHEESIAVKYEKELE